MEKAHKKASQILKSGDYKGAVDIVAVSNLDKEDPHTQLYYQFED